MIDSQFLLTYPELRLLRSVIDFFNYDHRIYSLYKTLHASYNQEVFNFN